MDLARPRFVFREEIFAARPQRAEGIRFGGLWVAGSLAALDRPTIAIVGSRAPSEGGQARARALGATLARAGICVISGLALGIDGAAHGGVVDVCGATVAVLGGGHRCFFPRRNQELAQRILHYGGAVVSPYAPDEPPRPPQFLQRNAVIAALADAVVIVEAAARSGALNTAGWASDLGIDVLAFPGDVDRALAAGCNALIRDGATLVRGPDDVLAAIGYDSASLSRSANGSESDSAARAEFVTRYATDPLARATLQTLQSGPADLEFLVDRLHAPAATVLATLVQLELAGAIERRDGGEFAAGTILSRGEGRTP